MTLGKTKVTNKSGFLGIDPEFQGETQWLYHMRPRSNVSCCGY
jgi:hypothetical protein